MDQPLRTLLSEMIRAGIVPDDVVEAAAAERRALGDEPGAAEIEMLSIAARSEPAADYAKRTRRVELRVLDGGNGGG